MREDSGIKGIYDPKNVRNIPVFADWRLNYGPYTIYCQITNRVFMYSYNQLIYIWDRANDKYYFTEYYKRSSTTSRHRNRALGFKLTDKLLKEMIERNKAELITINR